MSNHELLGQSAPPLVLFDSDGRRHDLAALQGRWVLLVFLRHLNCLLCRVHLATLSQRRAELELLGIQVFAVTFETPERARHYAAENELPWPLLVDEARLAYGLFGMGSGTWWELLHPRNWWAYFRLLFSGWWPKLPQSDVRQLGGDVLVDPQGVVRYAQCSLPADRPGLDELLRVVMQSGELGDGSTAEGAARSV